MKELILVLERLADIRCLGYNNICFNESFVKRELENISDQYKAKAEALRKIEASDNKWNALVSWKWDLEKEIFDNQKPTSKNPDEEVKKYKTLVDVLESLVTKFSKNARNGDPIDMEIYPMMKNELKLLNDWKMSTLSNEDTRMFRDLSIAYTKLEKAFELLPEWVKPMPWCTTMSTNNQLTSKILESAWNATTVATSVTEDRVKTDLDKLVELAYEQNVILESRNRQSGKTTALFNLGVDAPIIVPHVVVADSLNKKFGINPDDELIVRKFISFNSLKNGGYRSDVLIDELSQEQIVELERIGCRVVTGFMNTKINEIYLGTKKKTK